MPDAISCHAEPSLPWKTARKILGLALSQSHREIPVSGAMRSWLTGARGREPDALGDEPNTKRFLSKPKRSSTYAAKHTQLKRAHECDNRRRSLGSALRPPTTPEYQVRFAECSIRRSRGALEYLFIRYPLIASPETCLLSCIGR
jgi:hypothetical protein